MNELVDTKNSIECMEEEDSPPTLLLNLSSTVPTLQWEKNGEPSLYRICIRQMSSASCRVQYASCPQSLTECGQKSISFLSYSDVMPKNIFFSNTESTGMVYISTIDFFCIEAGDDGSQKSF